MARRSRFHVRGSTSGTRPDALGRVLDRAGNLDDADDADLLDILFTDDTVPGGAKLLEQMGNVRGVLTARLPELVRAGLAPERAARVLAASELARRAMRPSRPARVIRLPSDVYALVADDLAHLDHERLLVVCLDPGNRILAVQLASVGSTRATIVDPATVFRLALHAGAAAVIAVHNHPSGDPTPSRDDQQSTRVLMQVGILLRVLVIDHVVVAGDSYASVAQSVMGNTPYLVRTT